jgi:uncharacterized protein YjdB
LTLTEGVSEYLTATVYPENATNKSVTWSSNKTSVATVSSDGYVTAIKPGKATIKVTTFDGGYTAKCTVTVTEKGYPVTGVSLNRTSMTLMEGDSEYLTATVYPEDATDKSVTWSSSDNSVATVSSDGHVVAIKSGTATITVTTIDGGYTANCIVTVKAIIPVTGISLSDITLEMNVGGEYTLVATITPNDATNKKVIWASSNPDALSVDGGKLKALKSGRVTVTARTEDGDYTATCQVTVKGDGMDPGIGDWDTGEENSGDAE